MKTLLACFWAVVLWLGLSAQAQAANTFNVDSAGNVSATSLVTLAVSVTGNVSASTINGSVPSFGGGAWTSLTGVPAGIVNVSNSSGSVTVTTVQAARFQSPNTNTFVNGGGPSFTGDYTTSLGYQSLVAAVSGTQNTAIGAFSLGSATGQRTAANVAEGYAALFTLGFANTTSSSMNVGIGAGAGQNLQSGDKNIVIGAVQDLFSNTASNQLNIGGAIWGNIGPGVSNTNRIGINVQSPTTSLEVSGTVSATAVAGTLSTAAQTNVTSLGTLTGLTINGTLTMTGATNTVTASNVYATNVSGSAGTFGAIAMTGNLTGSPLISTSGVGVISTTSLNTLNLSATNITLVSTTLLAGQQLYVRSSGGRLVVDGSAGNQYDFNTNKSIFSQSDLPASSNPSFTVQVSGTLGAISAVIGRVVTGTATAEVYGNISATTISTSGVINANGGVTIPSGQQIVLGGAQFGDTFFQFNSGAIQLTTPGGVSFQLNGGTTGFLASNNGTINLANSTTGLFLGGGNTVASTTLHVSGTVLITGGVSMTGLLTGTAARNLCVTAGGAVISTTTLSGCLGVSDPLVKKDIKRLPYGLAEVLKVDAIMYKDIRPGEFLGDQVGLLAYDTTRYGVTYRGLEKAMPGLVDQAASSWEGKTLKGVAYERAIAVAFKAIQEQQAEIEELQRRAPVGNRSKWWERWRWLLTGN